jgi:predicted permease
MLGIIVIFFAVIAVISIAKSVAGAMRVDEEEAEVAVAYAGATFGPWSNHGTRCGCNVCR